MIGNGFRPDPKLAPCGRHFVPNPYIVPHANQVQFPGQLLQSFEQQQQQGPVRILEGPIYMLRVLPPPPPLIPIDFNMQQESQPSRCPIHQPFGQQQEQPFRPAFPPEAGWLAQESASQESRTAAENETQLLLKKLMMKVDDLKSENLALRKELSFRAHRALENGVKH